MIIRHWVNRRLCLKEATFLLTILLELGIGIVTIGYHEFIQMNFHYLYFRHITDVG